MKAFVLRAYGSPDVLTLTDVPDPVPADDEVLVRVRATSVNPYDWHHLRGEPRVARLLPGGLGLRRPAFAVLGCDLAGQVTAVGRSVTRFRPGDDVFALVAHGAFAEYARVREDLLAPKPRNLTYEEAAAIPMAGVTALHALRDKARLRADQTVLVNGASGGVGTFAVQIARASGATVVGVCRAHNADLVRSIGAAEVVDYTVADFTRQPRRYDAVVDIAGSRPVSACRRVLTRTGTFVVVGGPAGRWVRPADRMITALALSPVVPQTMAVADAVGFAGKRDGLVALTALVEAGTVTPVIDRRYAFDDLPAAVRYQEEGHARGKVVVSL